MMMEEKMMEEKTMMEEKMMEEKTMEETRWFSQIPPHPPYLRRDSSDSAPLL